MVLFSLTLLERQQLEQALQRCVTGTKSNNQQKWGHWEESAAHLSDFKNNTKVERKIDKARKLKNLE